VLDDGIGFDPQIAFGLGHHKGLGLTSMRERISAVGGTVAIDSSSGRGTRLTIRVPINSAEVKHAK